MKSICQSIRTTFLLYALIINGSLLSGQTEIPLINPSFEGYPSLGESRQGFKFPLNGWENWSALEGASTPDIHGVKTDYWGVDIPPFHGGSFVGLVTRVNSTWECIAQKLRDPLEPEGYYRLTLYLSNDTMHLVRETPEGRELEFNTPSQIQILGSHDSYEFDELLAESGPVEHSEWREYSFDLFPSETYNYLIIRAFYTSDTATNGHVLIDNAKLFKYE